jgi:hypothetical protein
MADRKILKGIRASSGRFYRTNATNEQMDQLEKELTPKEVERLTEKKVLQGFSGKARTDKDGNRARVQNGTPDQGPARALGTVKDDEGEPTNRDQTSRLLTTEEIEQQGEAKVDEKEADRLKKAAENPNPAPAANTGLGGPPPWEQGNKTTEGEKK